jgi:hypothetical protein
MVFQIFYIISKPDRIFSAGDKIERRLRSEIFLKIHDIRKVKVGRIFRPLKSPEKWRC